MSYHSIGRMPAFEVRQQQQDASTGTNPIDALLDWISGAGLAIENAITDPKVQKWMREANIKITELVAEEEQRKIRRKASSSMLKWGVAATAVVALLILKKKKR